MSLLVIRRPFFSCSFFHLSSVTIFVLPFTSWRHLSTCPPPFLHCLSNQFRSPELSFYHKFLHICHLSIMLGWRLEYDIRSRLVLLPHHKAIDGEWWIDAKRLSLFLAIDTLDCISGIVTYYLFRSSYGSSISMGAITSVTWEGSFRLPYYSLSSLVL